MPGESELAAVTEGGDQREGKPKTRQVGAAAGAATIDALQSHLAAERTRGDAAGVRADRAEIRAGALADRAHVLQADLGTAQAEADALRRADAERRARGLLARLRAALRGE